MSYYLEQQRIYNEWRAKFDDMTPQQLTKIQHDVEPLKAKMLEAQHPQPVQPLPQPLPPKEPRFSTEVEHKS
jgi:hypothetical protein